MNSHFFHLTGHAFLLLFFFSIDLLADVPDSPIQLQWKQDASLNLAFQEQNVQGVFVVLDPASNTVITNDIPRARRQFPPASTFKIPNTIIGLVTKAVKDVDEVLPYGGHPQPIKEWERDMSLRDAIRISNVPVYQELARRIGAQRMSQQIQNFQYGNATIGEVIDRFWLDGPLRISAVEQTLFLQRYLSGKIPGTEPTIPVLNSITLLETSPDQSSNLHGKTGWCIAEKPAIGWWVGWIQSSSQNQPICYFALNIDMPDSSDAPKRLIIGKQLLKKLGYW